MAPLNASDTVAPNAPITYDLPVPVDLDSKMESPSVSRAQVAATPERPQGSADFKDPQGMSVLQQHVEFWDRRKTGSIMPWDTYAGFRALGWNIFFSFIFTIILNGSLSYATQDGWLPDPLFSVKVRNIHNAKHGSDSHVFDYEGRFSPEKFEALFSRFDRGNKGALTFRELWDMTEHHRCPFDFFGWQAGKLEWGLTYWLLRDEKGLVSKEAVRGSFDGSIYYKVEAARKKGTQKQD